MWFFKHNNIRIQSFDKKKPLNLVNGGILPL